MPFSDFGNKIIPQLDTDNPKYDGFITKHFQEKLEEYWESEFNF
jgi:hypothetical protein